MNFNYLEDLVVKAQEGDMDSKEKILKEFKPFILNLSKKTFIHGYDFQDIENECYSILLRAIKMYRPKEHRFVAYATTAIKNSLYLIIKDSIKKSETEGKDALTFTGNLEDHNLYYEGNVDSSLCKTDDLNTLKEALSILTPKERILIDFIFIQNNTVTAYTKKYKVPYSTTIFKRNKALKKMYTYLKSRLF